GAAPRNLPFQFTAIRLGRLRIDPVAPGLPSGRSGVVRLADARHELACSVPASTCSFNSLFDFGTRSAARTFAVRSSTFMKSSIEMRAASGAAADAAGAGAGAAGAGAPAASGTGAPGGVV